MKFYISKLYNDTPTIIFTAVRDYVDDFRCVDGRDDPTIAAGFVLAECDPAPAIHAAMIVDPRITYIDLGGVQSIDDPISIVPDMAAVTSLFESNNMPVSTPGTIRELIRGAIKALCVNQMLGGVGQGVGLDVPIPAPALDAITNRMKGRGFNLNFTGTRRDFINHLIAQDNKYLRTHHDH